MLDKSRLYTGEDGEEYFSTILINVSQTRKIQDELHFLTERYQIIMEQTNDVICEWDAQKDQLTCSSNWIKKFGFEPIREQASRRILNASHIHPEDLPLFISRINNIRGGATYEEMDLRSRTRPAATAGARPASPRSLTPRASCSRPSASSRT